MCLKTTSPLRYKMDNIYVIRCGSLQIWSPACSNKGWRLVEHIWTSDVGFFFW